MVWTNVDDCDIYEFPTLDDVTLRLLTLGTYQLKPSSIYIQEYIGGDCDMQVFKDDQGLLRVRLQSRHVALKSYLVWLLLCYNQKPINVINYCLFLYKGHYMTTNLKPYYCINTRVTRY